MNLVVPVNVYSAKENIPLEPMAVPTTGDHNLAYRNFATPASRSPFTIRPSPDPAIIAIAPMRTQTYAYSHDKTPIDANRIAAAQSRIGGPSGPYAHGGEPKVRDMSIPKDVSKQAYFAYSYCLRRMGLGRIPGASKSRGWLRGSSDKGVDVPTQPRSLAEGGPMAFSTRIRDERRGLAAERVWRRADDFRIRLKYRFPVSFAALWVTVLLATALIGWLSGQLHLAVSFLGAGLIVIVSGAASVVTLSAVASRLMRRQRVPVAVSPVSPVQLPEIVELAARWSDGPAAHTLTTFLDNFDGSLSALRIRLSQMLGHDMGRVLPLHQEISFAEELGIWSTDAVTGWRKCLRVRTEILTEGAEVPISTLARQADWLRDLADHTLTSPVR